MRFNSALEARIVDPALTKIVQGYNHVARVGHVLFPAVNVDQRGGKVVTFGKESFRRYNARRTPGSDTLMIHLGYEGAPYALVQDALDTPAPREYRQDAEKNPSLSIGARCIETLMNTLTLNLEYEQAELATNPANYKQSNKVVLSSSDCWDHPDSNPEKMIDDAKDAVRMRTGVDPNVMVISKPVFTSLKNHPKIIERFKYTSADSVTINMLASLFDLDKLAVGKAAGLSSPDKNAPFEDIWGNLAVLAYAPQNKRNFQEPSFGYTYTLTGHPFAEKPSWDNSKKSHIYGVTYERLPVLTGMSSGFLIQNVNGGQVSA